ncbi:hypothetical protein Enr10x_34480 [Gimesia panareensis]|uniref:Uncharacterized protein n=1 Tax=Gimesia panareensis TaxID=2527978 RepID=A0A517Q900_9PLAN|nr:hypothetical protein [Gimesia panareensis]QDT28109.1 hypothetical protein Enr10x_34480 [Gimesia panareensis]
MHTAIEEALEKLLPTQQILDQLSEILADWGHEVSVGEEEERVHVAPDTKLELISKSALYTPYDLCFGTGFKVIVAIGGVVELDEKRSHIVPGICFITLWYNKDRKLITTDLSDTIL